MRIPIKSPRSFLGSALLFLGIGALIYIAAYLASEQLVYRNGKTNPFFKIAITEETQTDWIILGASHAMVLDFADFENFMEQETGQTILNLAAPGTGPLYNRLVLEQFLGQHQAKNILYVIDSFAFQSRTWNEDRFLDAKLLRRTPFDPNLALRLAGYVFAEGVDPRALLDYVTGFSKLNNQERFDPDIWEGEAQFERRYRPSAVGDQNRIDYLYSSTTDAAVLERYLSEFSDLIALARMHGANVSIIKMPVPSRFHVLLPNESDFDGNMAKLLSANSMQISDFSLSMDEARFYFDTDHMSRVGLTEFFGRHLKSLLTLGG